MNADKRGKVLELCAEIDAEFIAKTANVLPRTRFDERHPGAALHGAVGEGSRLAQLRLPMRDRQPEDAAPLRAKTFLMFRFRPGLELGTASGLRLLDARRSR